MESVHRVVVLVHIVAAVVALASMWIPMLSKKGGRVHRRAGWVFASSMALTCVTSFMASASRIVANPEDIDAPLFLILVGMLAAVSTLWGVRILRQKNRTAGFRGGLEWASSLALFAAGIGGLLYGLLGPNVLFIVFGTLSAWVAFGFIRVLRTPPSSRWFWWYEHLGGMLVGCISAVTAFAVVNWVHAPASLQSAIPKIAVWIAPGVIGGASIAYLNAHYRRRLEK